MNKQVTFIGAGPGDPELISVKGKRIIEQSDVIIYTGSLVNPALFDGLDDHVELYDSASMSLDEVIDRITVSVHENKMVARVHTGEPSLYGAIREQMIRLDALGISYEVVPGISSFAAAAAAVQREFTLPGVSQSLILTRMEGRTSVPELESIELFSKHQTSMAIFLSVQMIEKLVSRLLEGYPKDTPIAVIQRASWPDQKIVMGTLEDIAKKVKEANITKTAQILVGRFLTADFEESKLYDASFSHEYRRAKE